MNIGSTLHHWRFGPLILTEIENTTIYVEVGDPKGLVGTPLEKIPKKFDTHWIGEYLFPQPEDVLKSPRIDQRYFHKSYSLIAQSKETYKFSEQKETINRELSNLAQEIQDLEAKINDAARKYSDGEKRKNELKKVISEQNLEMEKIIREIIGIKNEMSPREFKKTIKLLPEKEGSEVKIRKAITINEETLTSIEQKNGLLEIERLNLEKLTNEKKTKRMKLVRALEKIS